MAGFYPIRVEVDGRACRGEWCLRQGGQICVRSLCYGSLTVPTGTRKPEVYAPIVLAILIRHYYRRQEQHRLWQEQEARRLGGRRRRRLELT